MNRIATCFIVISLILPARLFGQATQPALPDSPDVVAVKAAAVEFFTALTDDDISPSKKLFGGSDEDFKSIEQLHTLVVAIKAYKATADKQFPGTQSKRPLGNDLDPKAMAVKVQKETVTVTGDSAKLQDSTEFKHLNGKWKVTNMMGDPQTKQMMSLMMPAFVQAANDTTTEIAQGKYTSYDEADKAMQLKLRTAAMAMMAKNMGAATRPTK